MQLSNTELSTFFDQMAMILHAGIPAIEGLAIMKEDAASKEGGEILDSLYTTMEATGFLYTAMEDAAVFPPYATELIRIGEQTGHLEKVLRSLAVYYTRQEDVRKSIKSAVSYPLIMIGMMLVIILVLIIKVLPMFNDVFVQLGSEMTGISRSVMDIGMTLSRYSFIFVIVLAVIAAAVIFLGCTKKGAAMRSRMACRFFATKKLTRQMAVSKFAAGMALTLGSGLDVEESLEMTGKLIDHPEISKSIDACKALIVEEQLDFSQALAKTGIFTGVYARMVSIGYKTGALDELMDKIASAYEDEIDTRMNRLISILEPTLVAILSIIVGMILLSVMLPLLGIMSNIG